MKIAFVFDGLGFGGIERIGIDYVTMSKTLGYDVDVYNLNPKDHGMANQLPESVSYKPISFSRKKCPEIYSYGIQKWWWGKYAYAVLSPILSLCQLVLKLFSKKEKYDVAIAISGHINDLSFVAKNFIKSDKKIVWCHGNLISYLAICDAYSILYKKIDKIVTLSSAAEKDVYPGRKYLYKKEIKKIYNPTFIQTKELNDEFVNILQNQYGDYMLMIARAEFRKGYDIAIDVIAKLKQLGLDKVLLIAGDGADLNKYKSYAQEKGVSEQVVFLGNKSDIQNYIAGSYIDVLTSKWEGLPTVIVEAMAMGKPCVMTNSDDGEVSGSGKYCDLLPVDDVDGIANAIYKLYTDKGYYDKQKAKSLERAKSFLPDLISKQFVELIEN